MKKRTRKASIRENAAGKRHGDRQFGWSGYISGKHAINFYGRSDQQLWRAQQWLRQQREDGHRIDERQVRFDYIGD
jgi:hypothetical protein